MKTKITYLKNIYLLLFICILGYPAILVAQTPITCNCKASDLNIAKVELVSSALNPLSTGNDDKYIPLGSSCSSDTPVDGIIKVTISQNANTRYGTNIYADVYIDNQYLKTIHTCSPLETTGNFVIYLDANSDKISWLCATNITLKNVFIGWGNSAGSNACTNGNENNLCYTAPHCSEASLSSTFTVITPLNANFSTESTCTGISEFKNITFSSTSTGGTLPYQYKWIIFDGTSTTVSDYSANASYTYTPTSNHNLDVTLSVKDSTNPQKTSSTTQTGIAVETCCTTPKICNKNAVICSNTAFTIDPSVFVNDIVPSGTTYTWSNPVSSPVGAIIGGSAQNNGILGPISQTLINTSSSPATLTYTVIPKSGPCIGSSFSIVVEVKPVLSLGPISSTNVTCYGNSDGTASVGTILGSVDTINYLWKNSSDITIGTESSINNLTAGTYTLTVSDNCSSKSESVTITQPAIAVSVSGTASNVSCYGLSDGS
ncbi:PKD-like domain-containing protein, partial [Flavobacterium aestuarii]|uniref:PKD-like domain-containing protein n=1 Tax=Flavobacterium aestuarii TaxID=3149227 RepID=UPI0032B5A5F2